MKILIKEIAKREGKKSQTSIANIREILKVLAEILVNPISGKETEEFLDYLQKTAEKIWKQDISGMDLTAKVKPGFNAHYTKNKYDNYIEKKYGKLKKK